jgi:FKBP-type peptidyl-prolyl cis-trans isomerase FklB
MKTLRIMTALVFMAGVTAAAAEEEARAPKPESLDERASYSIGLNLGTNLRDGGVDVAVEQMIQGLKDGLSEADPALTQQEIQETMMEFSQIMQAKEMERMAEASEKNLAEGEAFLNENSQREGVTVLPSGLQYEVLREGDGPKPGTEDGVTVHYHGTLIDGTVFDSSVERGEPFALPALVGPQGPMVIDGWVEALQLMPAGSKWRLFIPADLAYGESERGPGGPHSTLIFDVELISIQDN